MSGLRWLRSFALVVCVAAVLNAMPVFGAVDPHHLDGSTLGAPLDLSSTWLLQQGDDPRWADPKLDDSQWKVVQAGKTLSSYGLKDVDLVWYRTHVRIPPGQKNLSLLMRGFAGSFEVFVNGIEVGSSGPHQPGGTLNGNFSQRFAIPDAAVSSGDVTIAVRGSIGRSSDLGRRSGGFASATKLLFGATPSVSDIASLFLFRSYASNTANIGIELLVPLIALALALTLPKEREYVALVVSSAAAVCVDIYGSWHAVNNGLPSDLKTFLLGCMQAIQLVALLEFVRLVLGLRRSRWWVCYEGVLAVLMAVAIPWVTHVFEFGPAGPTNSLVLVVNTLAELVMVPVSAGLPLLALWVWWRRRNPDALLLFVPLLIQTVITYCQFGFFALNMLHLSERDSLPAVPTDMFRVGWQEVAQFFFNVALLVFLVLRTARLAKASAAMASDLHAVQSVQEILLARASHPTPGFRVEHVYLPAQEVGGDFFLVSPGPDGSLTAIVGDVSGKGLVAAMRVSMILGVLRREEEREPGMVLKALNDALLMQNDMGFTTACCIHLDREGCYAVANAGHISPYIDGFEIVTDPSLPLGMAPGQEYQQISGLLPEGKTIVLMSDGVVEARSAKGELYGFERLAKLTLMKAEDIADVARRFGQEDDITVLTVSCA